MRADVAPWFIRGMGLAAGARGRHRLDRPVRLGHRRGRAAVRGRAPGLGPRTVVGTLAGASRWSWDDDPARLPLVLRARSSGSPSSSCRRRSARVRRSSRASRPSSTRPRPGPADLRPRDPVDVGHRDHRIGRHGRGARRPAGSDEVAEVGTLAAEAAITLATLLTIVFFWLVEHARLQRYLLAFAPANGGPASAMRGTRSRPASASGSAANCC